AQREAELSQYRVVGVYGGILALGYNTELFDKKKLPVPKCWKDLLDPAYKGEVMLSNPNSSGTGYLMLASLVQIFGEDEAFRYLKALNVNVNQYARSGIGPMSAVIRGETAIGSTVLHGVVNEIERGFPVKPVLPCEGVGYEVGSMAIIKGARHPDNAKKFFDWALTPEAQRIGVGGAGFVLVPWYALQDSIASIGWLKDYTGKDNAPALLQALKHGRVWLLPIIGFFIAATALLQLPISRLARANGLLVVGAAGFVFFLAQGFAIGAQGWSFELLTTMFGPLATGQYGMGWGAALCGS